MSELTARQPSWMDYLPGNVQQAWNTSPVVNALTRLINKPTPDLTRGIEYDQYGSVADRNWLLEAARGGPPQLHPLASEMLDKGSTLAMFLGPAAKTADLKALVRAQTKTAAGVPREQVWKEDGWFKGPDGKWRFEIDDAALTVREGTGYDRVQHDTLSQAYPQMRYLSEIERSKVPFGGWQPFGGRDPGGEFSTLNVSGPQELWRRIAAHELQHGVQYAEPGFSTGGNPFQFAGRNGVTKAALDKYRRVAGEVEARAVEQRLPLTPEQRRERPPWLDYDVPEAQQIVRGQ